MVLRKVGALLLVLAASLVSPARADEELGAPDAGLPPPAALEDDLGLPLPALPSTAPTSPVLGGSSTSGTGTGGNALARFVPANGSTPATTTVNTSVAPVASSNPSSVAPINSVATTGIASRVAAPAKKAPAKPATPTPNPNANPYAYYGGGGGGGGGSRSSDQMGTGSTLTYPEEPAKGEKTATGGSSSSADSKSSGGSAGPSLATATTSGSDSSIKTDGIESIPTKTSKPAIAPTPAPTPAPVAKKAKHEVEGRVVLFLRTPGEEDPSHEGVKARLVKESRIVARLAPALAKGEIPATQPEDGILRDPAPVGFYLPEEIDAWMVTPEGAMIFLETDGPTFETVASFGLGAPISIVGSPRDLGLIGEKAQVVKIQRLVGPGPAPAPIPEEPAPAPVEAPDEGEPAKG